MQDQSFDIVIIGGGPGGYVAAIRAAQLGLKAALVEREHLGGVCLNWGCIPTKALLRSAEVYHQMTNAADFGLSASAVSFDLQKVVQRSRTIAAKLSGGVRHLLMKNKVAVFEGQGRLAGPGRVRVAEGPVLAAPHIVLATGARARVLPGLETDGQRVWSYRDALVPDRVPKTLLIVGAGAIGVEFASFFHALGSGVTLVETLPRILPNEDEEISEYAAKAFVRQGMTVLTEASVAQIARHGNGVIATLEVKGRRSELKAERVISAVGIVGNVEDLGLEGTRVVVEKGHVVTDAWSSTGEPGVYAIGDLAGPPWLAHKASHEGILCVERIAGVAGPHPLNASRVPACTYARPQVASLGLSEARAKARGLDVKVGRFPFIANGKAAAEGETEGFVKTIFDARTGELLGAHMIGAHVTELIQGFTLARTLEATEADLMHTIFPHPTLSEMMHESVLDAFRRAIHF